MSSGNADGASDVELVTHIAALAAELAAQPAPDSGAACYEQVEALGHTVDLIESAIAARVAVATRSGQVAEWGHTSPTAWLRTSLDMRHARADERAVLAAQLPRLPQVAKRLTAGYLSAGYAVAIATGVRRLDETDCEKAEDLLLRFVDDGHSVAQIARFADRIKDLIAERDDTAAEPEDGRQAGRQWWTLHRSGHGTFVKGHFGPELTALIKTKLEPLATPCGADDTRDHAGRLADALQTFLSEGDSRWDPILLIDLKQPQWIPASECDQALRGAAASDPSSEPAQPDAATSSAADQRRPHTRSSVTAGAEPRPAMRWVPQPPAPGWPFDGTPYTARLTDGTPIPVERARSILLNAGFSALILGADGHPLYLGRRVRCATPAQRRALQARYATCVVDGCDIPAIACQIDHVHGWENDQPTDIDQLVMCCAFHNRYKWRHPDRVLISRRDDGRYRYQIVRPGTPRHGPKHNYLTSRSSDRGP